MVSWLPLLANCILNIKCTCFCCRCYARALKLMPEVPSLWYDLGLNYYRQAISSLCPTEGDHDSSSLLLEKAQQVILRVPSNRLHSLFLEVFFFFWSSQCLKKAIMMDSSSHSYWNALGVISMNKGNCMHCFRIKKLFVLFPSEKLKKIYSLWIPSITALSIYSCNHQILRTTLWLSIASSSPYKLNKMYV